MKFILPATLALAALHSSVASQHPIIPGVERLRTVKTTTAVERGTVLLGELSCTACHAANDAHVLPRRAPDLGRIGARVTSTWLRDYLTDPRANKPGTLMPNCMPDVDDKKRASDVNALVHYLVSRGGPIRPASMAARRPSVEAGRRLFQSIGCVACHAPDDGRKTKVSSVPFGKLAHKMTVDSLRAFLRDPHSTRPAGRMPDLWLTNDESLDLAMFLLREQMENPQADDVLPPSKPGLTFEYFELDTNELPDFELLATKAQGTVTRIQLPRRARRKNFAVRLLGDIKVPDDGAYTFELSANDGARLLIDGYVVIDDDRKSGKSICTGEAELRKGTHSIEVQYFQHGRGKELDLSWTVPGSKNRRVPDNVLTNRRGRAMIPLGSPGPKDAVVGMDKRLIKHGRELFLSLRCAACHEPGAGAPQAKPLSEVDPKAKRSCLSESPAVDFGLSDAQNAELRATLAARAWTKMPKPDVDVRRTLAAFNCYGCHARENIGGPEQARYDLFKTRITIDLGDEGKVPPPLTAVGEKLRPDVLHALIAEGKHRIRERFMYTRMPGFRTDAVKSLVKNLVAADRPNDKKPDTTSGVVDKKAVAAGRRLVGLDGFACVTCHNVNGDRSAAIPGVDLATAQTRLTKKWFAKFMRKPSDYRQNTRMPGFWGAAESPFKDILGGSSEKQIDAVWTYLSLGKSIPAPKGVQGPRGGPRAELFPRTEPIVHRTFMTGVGGRTILAGFPEKLHVAFDAHSVRLAKVWRGRFFDASGVASGRSGKFLGPLGEEVLDLPAPSFARLQQAKAAWPVLAKNARDVGGEYIGFTLDKGGHPTFRYRASGVDIREQPLPKLYIGGAVLRRLFRLKSDKPPIDFYFRAWTGKKIEKISADTWRSGDVTIVLKTDPRDPVRIRTVDGQQELVVMFVFRGGEIRFEEEIRW
jgi:mono/diheme cytochrome c family protein